MVFMGGHPLIFMEYLLLVLMEGFMVVPSTQFMGGSLTGLTDPQAHP
jgi:hypothetical protein